MRHVIDCGRSHNGARVAFEMGIAGGRRAGIPCTELHEIQVSLNCDENQSAVERLFFNGRGWGLGFDVKSGGARIDDLTEGSRLDLEHQVLAREPGDVEVRSTPEEPKAVDRAWRSVGSGSVQREKDQQTNSADAGEGQGARKASNGWTREW